MQARLKVLHDKANVKQVKLLPVTLIGRSTDCNLKIASSQVSRNHCRITLGSDSVFVEDLGSANGTLVDGQPIPPHQPTAIAPGAHLIVGPAEFQIDYVASTSQTMVLPRNGVAQQPELPSTEMIFPTGTEFFQPPAPVASAPAPVAASPVVVAPEPIAETQPVFAQPDAVVAPAAIAAAVAAAVVAQQAEATDSDTVFLPQESNGAEAPVVEGSDEQTMFMFSESVPDSIPFGQAATTEEPAVQKGGLKSLFSMFGRKEKPQPQAAHSATAVTPSPAPSVFLPTMDAPAAEAVESVSAAVTVADAASVDAGTDTLELDAEAPQAAAEPSDDGFQQFLSQF